MDVLYAQDNLPEMPAGCWLTVTEGAIPPPAFFRNHKGGDLSLIGHLKCLHPNGSGSIARMRAEMHGCLRQQLTAILALAGDVRSAAYQVLLQKSQSTAATLAGITLPDQQKYWLRLAAQVRKNGGRTAERADKP